MCHFQDGPVSSRIAGSFSIDWWPEDIAWIAVHVALVAAYLAWRSSAGFDAVIIAVNLFCVIVHLIAMAAPDLTEADR